MSTARAAAVSLLLITLAGCAAPRVAAVLDCASLKMPPVTAQEQRIEFGNAGFSVMPPQGEHWCVRGLDSTGVGFSTGALLGRRLDARPPIATAANSLGLMALVMDPGEWKVDTADGLRAYAEHKLREEPGRFRNRATHVSPDPTFGAECVRTEQIVEERHNPRLPGAVLIMINRQVFCRHPDASRRVIFFGASERYAEGDPGPRLLELRKDQIDGFVRSLRFMQPR